MRGPAVRSRERPRPGGCGGVRAGRFGVSRQRIIEGAESLLDTGQYSSLTVDALARSLRMSKSTLYKYFSSKEDVVVALVREICDQADLEIERTLQGGTCAEQLTDLADVIGRHGQRLPRAVLTEPERLPIACAQVLAQTRDNFAFAAHLLLERGVDSGEFAHSDPRVVAVAFVASADAVLADAVRRGVEDYGAVLDHLPALFLAAVAPGQAQADTSR